MATRQDHAIIETFRDEAAELLDKTLVMNQEVDFAEFSYDVKLFRVSKKTQLLEAFESAGGVQPFAYHVEVFNMNEPDKIYMYRVPVSHERVADPITFSAEVFNLVHYDLSQITQESVDEAEEQSRKPEPKQKMLIRRYVDNNIILVVQMNKFPATIGLMLSEVSSGLQWNCVYEL